VDVVLRDVDRAVISGIAIAGTTVSLGSVGTTATIPQTKLRMSVDPNPATGPVRIAVLGLRAAAEESSAGSPQAHAADGAPSSESIEIVIHDIAGRSVRTLLVSSASPQVYWDGLDASGQRVARGVYFVVGTTPDGQRALAKVVRLD
jgi:hypothetical protein